MAAAYMKMQSGEATQLTNQESRLKEEFLKIDPNKDKANMLQTLKVLRKYPDFVYYSVKLLVLAIKVAEENNIQWQNYAPSNLETEDFSPQIYNTFPWLQNPELPTNISIDYYGLSPGLYDSFVVDINRMLNNITRPIYL